MPDIPQGDDALYSPNPDEDGLVQSGQPSGLWLPGEAKPTSRAEPTRRAEIDVWNIDESGGFKDLVFAMTSVTTSAPGFYTDSVEDVLEAHGYRNELKYSNTDRKKYLPACELIDLILRREPPGEPSIRFYTVITHRETFDYRAFRHNPWNMPPMAMAYNVVARHLVDFNKRSSELAGPHRNILRFDKKTRSELDNLLEYLPMRIPSVQTAVSRDSRHEPLIQLADLIGGSIYGATMAAKSGRPMHPEKRRIADHLLERLGWPDFGSYRQKRRHSKIDVWHLRPNPRA